jgi:hypothetical protein
MSYLQQRKDKLPTQKRDSNRQKQRQTERGSRIVGPRFFSGTIQQKNGPNR